MNIVPTQATIADSDPEDTSDKEEEVKEEAKELQNVIEAEATGTEGGESDTTEVVGDQEPETIADEDVEESNEENFERGNEEKQEVL